MSKGGAKTQQRTTVIHRTAPGSSMSLGGGGGYTIQRQSMRQSYGAPVFAAGTLSDISHTGVNTILNNRAKEKHDIQGLNERLASYIEKVRFLEAQNKALLLEVERLKKMKGFDPSEIKNLYEQEIKQMRTVIDDLTKEKADYDATLAGLEDKLECERRERVEAEKINTQLKNDIDRLNSQIGDYEGELASLRGRVGMLEDDNKRLKEKNDRQEDLINNLRVDLDNETTKRINAENELQMLREELELKISILEAEIEQYKQLLDRDKTVEIRDVWRNELRKCVAEMQNEYDKKLNIMKADYDSRMETQMRALQAGVQRDNMETLQAREESKKLKSKLGDFGPRMAELEAENSRLKALLSNLENEYEDYRNCSEAEKDKLEVQVMDLKAQLDAVMIELQGLQDAKLSLELEIGCYRKLLEGEESKLSTLVQEASGARNKGADALADMIQQQSRMNEAQGKVTIQKSSRGPIQIAEATIEGALVELENTKHKTEGKDKKPTKPQNLKGWRLERTGSGRNPKVTSYEFGDIELKPGQTIRVFGKAYEDIDTAADRYRDGDCITNFNLWGSGTCDIKLYDEKHTEKASLHAKVSM